MAEPSSQLKLLEQTWRPIARLAVYYSILVAIYLVLVWISPWMADHLTGVPRTTGGGTGLDLRVEPNPDTPAEAAVTAVLTMTAALLLTLPVIWVYTFARQKRGFQQSLAQTLIMLPIVVGIVVVLVKHSTALAFSLGGIVGAVAFRNRLEDTKDAVYVFVAIALGLAVGVHAYSVGLAASAFFNLVALGLWATDFARAPAPLAQEIAQKRVQLAKNLTSDRKTGEYVAQLDQHLLQSMTPDQLKALADQAIKRGQSLTKDLSHSVNAAAESREVALVVVAAGAGLVPDLRRAIDAALEMDAKQWRFEGEVAQPDGAVGLRYQIRCRKRLPVTELVNSLRRTTGTMAQDILLP